MNSNLHRKEQCSAKKFTEHCSFCKRKTIPSNPIFSIYTLKLAIAEFSSADVCASD